MDDVRKPTQEAVTKVRKIQEFSVEELIRTATSIDKTKAEEAKAALNELLERFYVRLRRWSKSHRLATPRGGFDTSGVIQETATYVALHLHMFKGTSEGEWIEWLQLVLDHKMIDRWRFLLAKKRNQRLQVPLLQPGTNGEELAHPIEADDTPPSGRASNNEQLLLALSKIDATEREVVRLRCMEDKSFESIAQLLGLSLEDTATCYDQGLKSLKRHLTRSLDKG